VPTERPNYRTIKRRVDAIDARESVRKRSGSKAANDRFRPISVLSTADLLPLERVQIDHTLVDVVIVDEADRLPIGRPWLTLVIDVASRAVLGFSVSSHDQSDHMKNSTLLCAVACVLFGLFPELFEWHTSREAKCLEKFIPTDISGTIQCDGYSGYYCFAGDRAAQGKPVLLAGCWAHYPE
jgi:Transposase IS66 family